MTGRTLDHYRVLEQIGIGGTGEVYRAIDQHSGSRVVIKVPILPLRSSSWHPGRLRQEARVLESLKHPNICAIRGAGRCDGVEYLVMELLEGRTLRAWMKGRPLPVNFLLSVALQTARALAAAHARRVLHGDLKPENVFVTRQGAVKVIDFGLAHFVSEESVARTGLRGSGPAPSQRATLSVDLLPPQSPFGTYAYMSPEQARGDTIDLRSDLFSFGIVLYEMAAGRRPFTGTTCVDTLASILRDDPPPPSTIGRRAQPGIDWIVRQCLKKDPAERWGCASEIAALLEHLQSGAAPKVHFARRVHARRTGAARGQVVSGREPCVAIHVEVQTS